tara:strand:- start:2610 stop:3095 length:486 start_codon:yes stop_codon:yes gene_type:complete
MKRSVIYPGSFDPLTNGHINIIKRASSTFDEVIVSVAINSNKSSLMTVDQRVKAIKKVFAKNKKVKVDKFEGLLVQYAKSKKVNTILRGMRTVQDFEYEMQMATSNNKLNSKIETVFMVADAKFSHISSSLIKDIIKLGGNAKEFVPEPVEKELKKILKKG